MTKTVWSIARNHKSSLTRVQADRELPAVHYLWRPISFWISAPLVHAGISANVVTGASAAMGIAGLWLVIATEFTVFGGVLVLLWVVLDSVDGNIARFLGASSAFGAVLDELGGLAMLASLFLLSSFVGEGGDSATLAGFAYLLFILARRDKSHGGLQRKTGMQRLVLLGVKNVTALINILPLFLIAHAVALEAHFMHFYGGWMSLVAIGSWIHLLIGKTK